MKAGFLACWIALSLPLAADEDAFVDVAKLEGKVVYKQGELSLAISPHRNGDVYLVNDTDKPIEDVPWPLVECVLEAKIEGIWRPCEPLDLTNFPDCIDCGNTPPLPPHKAYLLAAANGQAGDQGAEMRYALNIGGIVSTSFYGRYSSRDQVVREELKAVINQDWQKYPFAHSAEEFVALLELDRHYGELRKDPNYARNFGVTMGVDDKVKDRFEAAALEVISRPRLKNPGERALFERCVTALAARPGEHAYGSPENCRAMVWRRLSRPPGASNTFDSEPQPNWEAIRAFRNPWGVEQEQLAILVDLAAKALSSEDWIERAEAGAVLKMHWVMEEHLPQGGIDKLLQLDTREAKEVAAAIRGRAAAAKAAP